MAAINVLGILPVFRDDDDDDDQEDDAAKPRRFALSMGSLGPLNPLAALRSKIAGIKKAVGSVGLVALLGLSVLGLVRRKLQTNLLAGLEAKKAEIERTRRLEDARRELAGPLLVAAQALRERISDILQPNGFFETNFKDKTEAAVMSTMFIMCKYFHFRWRLHDSLQYESVSGKDRWQYAVDAVLADVNDAFTDKSKKYAIFSDNSDAFLSFAKASSEKGRVSGTTCVDSSSAFGKALDLAQQVQYPFRLLKEERDAIGEMMMNIHQVNERGRCLRYTEFVQRIHELLGASDKGRQHAWAPYFQPIWISIVRYAHLINISAEDRSLEIIREMIKVRLRLSAVETQLGHLIRVLSRSPLDPWFRQDKNLYSERKRVLRKKASRMWSLVANKLPELVRMQGEAEKTKGSGHLKSA
eukprot:jgi/Tetstr1/461066/TSEL_006213.t1